MRQIISVFLAGLLGVLLGCEDRPVFGPFDIPFQDEPSIDELETNPTPSIIFAASQGLLEGLRAGTESQISTQAHYGREGYYLSSARTVLDEFDEPLVPAGGQGWANAYNSIRTANTIRRALDIVSGMTDPEKEAVRGFVKTIEAYLLHTQIRVHDTFGIVVDTDRDRNDPLAPIVGKEEALAFMVQRLDEAQAHLQNAAASFPFQLSEGFAGFDTPASFIPFNRAIKARIMAEMADYDGVLTALNESFLDPAGELGHGVYNSYSTNSGDRTNPFFDPQGLSYLSDTTFVVDAQQQAGSALDARTTSKTAQSDYRTHTGVTSNLRWTLYATNTSPIPVIKNEELVLLRAEARMFSGDRAGAIQDLNVVRTRSGGLEPLSGDPGDPGLLNELLYNRRYSLVFEFGHRWVDLRRFDRLTDLRGPRGPGDRVFERVPLPEDECQQRNNEPAGCTQVDGFRTAS